MKIAICEDKAGEREKLKEILHKTKLFPNAAVLTFENGGQLIERSRNGEKFDIILMDVDMPKASGIQAGKVIFEHNPKSIIIFVTNYPQYAIDAYDCHAFHYLLKTDSFEKFYDILSGALHVYHVQHHSYALQTKDGLVLLKLADIYYIECYRKHLLFHTERTVYDTKGTLSETLQNLSGLGFYQVHQGYIVNFSKVKELNKNDFILQNGEKVMISVRKKTEVIRAYSEYLERYL